MRTFFGLLYAVILSAPFAGAVEIKDIAPPVVDVSTGVPVAAGCNCIECGGNCQCGPNGCFCVSCGKSCGQGLIAAPVAPPNATAWQSVQVTTPPAETIVVGGYRYKLEGPAYTGNQKMMPNVATRMVCENGVCRVVSGPVVNTMPMQSYYGGNCASGNCGAPMLSSGQYYGGSCGPGGCGMSSGGGDGGGSCSGGSCGGGGRLFGRRR